MPPFDEGDHSRLDPTADFGARPHWCDHRAPRRPCAEFLFVLMGDPSRLVTALIGNPGKHRVPASAHARIIDVGPDPAASIDKAKLAMLKHDVARRALGVG